MSHRHWAEVTGHERGRQATAVLVSVQDLDKGGFFLTAFDASRTEVSSTWHGGLTATRQWAKSQYGEGDVGKWHEIPDDVRDPATYALRQVRR
jgi:hypothetical protein